MQFLGVQFALKYVCSQGSAPNPVTDVMALLQILNGLYGTYF